MNGDSLDDIIALGLNNIFYYENAGNGGFIKHSVLDTINYFTHFTLFDWGNDGDLDIFFTSDRYSGYDEVCWLENDGNQNFTGHFFTDIIPDPMYIRVFDIDQDMDDDLLISSSSTDYLYWFKNDGLNNFNDVDTLGYYVNQFEIVDLNGDNDWDIVYARGYTGLVSSDIRCMQNDGNNNFTMITLKTGFGTIYEIVAEDINNDGYFDILIPDYYGDRLVWLKNDMSYNFSAPINIKTSYDGVKVVDLKDINEDGKKDIIAASANGDQMYYFQGTGSSTTYSFSAGTLIFNGLNLISDIAVGDFDNQTHKDLAHLDQFDDLLSVWINNGSQSFTQTKLAFSFITPRAFDMEDLDGDGDQDFAAASNDGDMIAWFENKGDETFETHVLIENYEEPYVTKIVDLDQDGDKDIIAASDMDDKVTWWENNGSGDFTIHHITTNLNKPRDLWVEDFDQDGDLDVAAIGYATPTSSGNLGLWWFQNDGFQNFTGITINSAIDGGRSIRGADMNGDSLIDLVVSTYYYGTSILVAVNNGTGFNTTSVATVRCEDFELIDFDGDNDNDIIAVDFNEDSLYFYENTGNLQFTRHTLGYKYRLYGIEPVDFDNDNDIDIIYATGYSGFTNASSFEIGLYRNDGLGNMTPEIWYNGLSMIKPLEIFDYENDGDVDVVVGFDYGNLIGLYKNLEIDCPLNVDAIATGNTDFCPGGSVELTAITVDTGIVYQWFNGNDSILNATINSLVVNESGYYKVRMSDSSCFVFSNVINVNVVINDTTNMAIDLCDGDSIEIGGIFISNTGTYTLNLFDQYGCDSIVIYNVIVHQEYNVSMAEVICEGDSYDFFGDILTESGTYYDTNQTIYGCDSILTLYLLVTPIDTIYQNATICNGDYFTFYNDTLTLPGIYTFTDYPNLCGEVHILELVVNNPDSMYTSASVCEGSGFDFFGNILFDEGVYSHTLQNQNLCDSVIYLDLSVNQIDTTQISWTMCEGELYSFYGSDLYASGTYYHTMLSSSGCDSIEMLLLDVSPVDTTLISAQICEGSTYDFFGNLISLQGQYTYSLLNQYLCDSLIILDLTVNTIDTTLIGISQCEGSIYNFFGTDITASGIFYHTLFDSLGCDSIIEMNALFLPVDSTILSFSGCDGDVYDFFGTDIIGSGIFYHTETNSFGCDSLFELHTLFLPVDTTYLYEEICGNDSLDFFGNSISTSGTYSHLLTNQFGCDSLIELELTVNPVFITPINATICQFDSYFFNDTFLIDPGSYSAILTSVYGCDSIINLDLEVNPVDSIYFTEYICDGDTLWFDGLPFTMQSVYQIEEINQYGCDSIISLDLTVYDNPVVDLGPDTTIFDNQTLLLDAGVGNISFLWQDGSATSYYFVDGSLTGEGVFEYYVEVTNIYFCTVSDTIVITVVHDNSIVDNDGLNLNIYPNPVKDELIIEGLRGEEEVSVRDLLGREINIQIISKNPYILDFSHLPEGIYVLLIELEGQVRAFKVYKLI